MNFNDLNLESRVFYRLVKVLYAFFLGLSFLGVFCVGYSWIPYKTIDNQKSYLTCPDGTKYSLDGIGLYFHITKNYSDYDTKEAIKACREHSLHKYKIMRKVTDPKLIKILNSKEAAAPYPTHWAYQTIGGWLDVIKIWFVGCIITFLILNSIKQAVLYIVYGKKFTLPIATKAIKKLQRAS